MAANMYRVGDYVFFESSSLAPFQIRRIEELNKTTNGNVEAKVMCFYRRRDLPNNLIVLADSHQKIIHSPPDTYSMMTQADTTTLGTTGALEEKEEISEREQLSLKQKHQLKHRELFLSRQVETLPATHIRGKCAVTLLNETESLLSYLNKDDTFFYSLVFDPQQRTLLADRGEIRVGNKYQAEPPLVLKEGENDYHNSALLETLVWTPNHGLSDREIDQFLVISRSVGTFARALDCSSSVKQPSLHMSAAAASRDVTLFHAMDTLHEQNYSLSRGLSALVPLTGPMLCRDEMEEWSASEANLFEEALEKYGKDFNDIRQDFLPWKSLKNIVEYYYMWKTTDRYVQQKRVKAAEAESKLKQVYIPNYNKPNPACINQGKGVINGGATLDGHVAGKPCESCSITVSGQWYAWGPASFQSRLCHSCWTYWKKYGGLKLPTRIDPLIEGDGDALELKKKPSSLSDDERIPVHLTSHRPHRCSVSGCGKDFKLRAQLVRHYASSHGLALRSGSPRPLMKTRTAFYLNTTPLTRLARRLCCQLLMSRHSARAPFSPINIPAIKQECQQQLVGKTHMELQILMKSRERNRGQVSEISIRLGQPERAVPTWLLPSDKSLLPKQDKIAYPRPPKGPDGSLIYERVPNRELEKLLPAMNNVKSSPRKRKGYDEVNGFEEADWEEPGWEAEPSGRRGKAPPVKRPATWDVVSGSRNFVCSSTMSGASGLSVPRPMLNHLNGKSKGGSRNSARKQVISWMDAPDDVYFRANDTTKKIRRQMTSSELRRMARKPWRRLGSGNISKNTGESLVVLD